MMKHVANLRREKMIYFGRLLCEIVCALDDDWTGVPAGETHHPWLWAQRHRRLGINGNEAATQNESANLTSDHRKEFHFLRG